VIFTAAALASAIRRTNARLAEHGEPEVPELDPLWAELMRRIEAADSLAEQERAIDAWEGLAALAIVKAARS
jgi:hypothetical protein